MQTSLTRLSPSFGPIAAPFAELDTLMRRFGDAFEKHPAVLDMRMDVEEEDGRFVVAMDIPGVKKDDIDVTVSGNVVTVRASTDIRKEGSAESGRGKGKKLHAERVFGESVRSFSLPVDVDPAQTTAAYEHGVLTLELPKLSGSQSHHVRVS